MRKTSKILVMLLIVMLIMFVCSFQVNAADVDGYEDLDEITKTDETKTDETDEDDTEGTDNKKGTNVNKEDDDKNNEKKEETNANGAGQANTPHPQTGSSDKILYTVVITAFVASIVLAYKKFKKYNY